MPFTSLAKGHIIQMATKIGLWPQHSSIQAYFEHIPNGMATLFHLDDLSIPVLDRSRLMGGSTWHAS